MRKIYTGYFILLIIVLQVCNSVSAKEDMTGKGYVGTLPDLNKIYEQERVKKIHAIPSKEFNSANELKPVPRDNPAFVNIILKTDKTSKYVNDLNEFIPMLEKLSDMIDEAVNTQVFNAKAYYFTKSADYFKDKYANKPESYFISYKKLLELSMHTKSIALLRTEAVKYNPYMAYGGSGYLYNPDSLTEQLEYLKKEIDRTLIILKEAN